VTAYVTTFYSFKGGVGRTTLLVNVAHVLADRGERVLIWDLDLEAPGIHQFPGIEPPEKLWQSGFLEWLGDTPPCPSPEPAPAWPSQAWLNTLGRRVYATRGQQPGSIHVLPALGALANLGRAYGAVDWHTLFVEYPQQGLHLLGHVRDALIAQFEPTFLLIDSRTGVSDLGGFLTGFVPDCTILVGNYSVQSMQGLRSVYLALDRFATERVQSEPHRRRKLDRLVVVSPVPMSPIARERGRERWSTGFPGISPRTLIEVPLVENLLYAEDILVRTAPSSDAARAYHEVAKRMLELRASHARNDVSRGLGTARKTRLGNVERLLQLLGFETGPSDHADLVARERTPVAERTYLVTYVPAPDNSTIPDLLEHMRSLSESARANQLLIVDLARDDERHAARVAGIALRTVRELEDQLVDLQAYAHASRRAFEDSELARTYVTQPIAQEGDDDALTAAMRWAAGHGPRVFMLVGEAGSGKTSLLRRLSYELVTRREDDPSLPVPLLIDLRNAGPNATFDTFLQDHLRAMIGWRGDPEAILYLFHAGRVVLLFDDLEDSCVAPGGVLRVLLRLVGSKAVPGATGADRLAVTARSPFVPADVLESTSDPKNVQIVNLAPFKRDQIATFLGYKLGEERAAAALARILAAPALAKLASRPLLLHLLTYVVEDADHTLERATAASIYDRYLARWISWVDGNPRGLLPAQRTQVLEHLAEMLWALRAGDISAEVLVTELGDTIITVDQLDLALRSAPFLARSSDGGYRFRDRGFFDYFLARYLVHCARAGARALRNALATQPLTSSCVALLAELVAAEPAALEALEAVIDGDRLSYASQNALQIREALGARSRA
jgi:hypothetical protein